MRQARFKHATVRIVLESGLVLERTVVNGEVIRYDEWAGTREVEGPQQSLRLESDGSMGLSLRLEGFKP